MGKHNTSTGYNSCMYCGLHLEIVSSLQDIVCISCDKFMQGVSREQTKFLGFHDLKLGQVFFDISSGETCRILEVAYPKPATKVRVVGILEQSHMKKQFLFQKNIQLLISNPFYN